MRRNSLILYIFKDVLGRERYLQQSANRLRRLAGEAVEEEGPLALSSRASTGVSPAGKSKLFLTPEQSRWMIQQGIGLTAPYHTAIGASNSWRESCYIVGQMLENYVRPEPETLELVAARIARDRTTSPEEEAFAKELAGMESQGKGNASPEDEDSELYRVDTDSEEYAAFVRAVLPHRLTKLKRELFRENSHDAWLLEKFLQMHRIAEALPKLTTIGHLAEMNIGWSAALKLIDYTKRELSMAPPESVYQRAIALCCQYRGKSPAYWKNALYVYHDLLEQGMNPSLETMTLVGTAAYAGGNREAAWNTALSLCRTLTTKIQKGKRIGDDAVLAGQVGSEFLESLLGLAKTCVSWELAIQALNCCDMGMHTSHRMLIPTPDALLHGIGVMLASRHYTLAAALAQVFEKSKFSYRDCTTGNLERFLATSLAKTDFEGLVQNMKLTLPVLCELLLDPPSEVNDDKDKSTSPPPPSEPDRYLKEQLKRLLLEAKLPVLAVEERERSRWEQILHGSDSRRILSASLQELIVRRLASYASAPIPCPGSVWVLAMRCFVGMHEDGLVPGREPWVRSTATVGRALSRTKEHSLRYHSFLEEHYPEVYAQNNWFPLAQLARNTGDWLLGLRAVEEYTFKLAPEQRANDIHLLRELALRSMFKAGKWDSALELTAQWIEHRPATARKESICPPVRSDIYGVLLQLILRYSPRRLLWKEALHCAIWTDNALLHDKGGAAAGSASPEVTDLISGRGRGRYLRQELQLVLQSSPLGKERALWIVDHLSAIRQVMDGELLSRRHEYSTAGRGRLDCATFW